MYKQEELEVIRDVVREYLPTPETHFHLKVNGAIDMIGIIVAAPLSQSERRRLTLALYEASERISKPTQFYIEA